MKKLIAVLALMGSFAHADYNCSAGPLTKAFTVPLAPGQPDVYLFSDEDGAGYWLGLTAAAKPVYKIKVTKGNDDVMVIAGDAGDAFAFFNGAKHVQIICNKTK